MTAAASAEVVELTKICSGCKIAKPYSAFWFDPRRGVPKHHCKECAKAEYRRRYHAKPALYYGQYERKIARRIGDLPPGRVPEPPLGDEQICNTCCASKPLAEFYKVSANKHGISRRCRDCARVAKAEWYAAQTPEKREARRQKRKAEYAADPVKYRRQVWRSTLRVKYGLSETTLRVILENQGNACAICRRRLKISASSEKRLQIHVDHDHATDVVRGILCSLCNPALGLFGDNIATLESAVAYLKKHGTK